MNSIIPTFQTKRLQLSSNDEEYNLYRAALEWNLIDPIVIENKNDIHSKQNWRNLVEPYDHQVTNLITFCRRLPVTLLSDDVGLGKTISAGLVASELMSRGRVSKILVVCPKLLMPQWGEELRSKFNIESVEAVGQKLTKAKPPNNIGAVITTYHSAKIYLDTLGKAGFEMLILDEAHKLRNLYGTQQAPQVALRFQKALADRLFKYVLMLTATPIQNRLWDIYSLVDLLTVARGHENPFGTQGNFARNFIADSRTEARQLKPEKRDEFRSIVYGYMSRTRRNDVPLLFPEREVQLHKVDPTPEELELLKLIAEPIQKLNRLVQISILQALVSSPHALAAQLENSARNGTVPKELAVTVRSIVSRMKTTAKLEGLGVLIDGLKKEQGENWRAVIFTERRETQTTLEDFLTERGVTCGLINGESGSQNQETIAKFKMKPPQIHVIVSTRAGSEGVNLQAANVLVNYDLPWNPMIVEQRIGRIQRLASEHASVCIFNMILRNTFEEYIVGRLMEKLQMASHAIGDIEALLEAAGMDEDDNSSASFEEKIRELVLASLRGQDIQEATRLAEESIGQARLQLEQEERNINTMLGGMDGAIDLGPRCPKLPTASRSMPAREFAIKSLDSLGAKVSFTESGLCSVKLDGKKELIRFDTESKEDHESTLCRPGSPFFDKLVTRISATPLHLVEDIDKNIVVNCETLAKNWVDKFGGLYNMSKINDVRRCFTGITILRVRVTVTHDSYERLLEIECSSQGEFENDKNIVEPVGKFLEDPVSLGLPIGYLKNKVMEDAGVSEFCRFYLERLEEEIKATGQNPIKKKKIEDDFTPRIEISLVGLEGKLHREVRLSANYKIEENNNYNSLLTINPSSVSILEQPEIKQCEYTKKIVPVSCLERCEISGKSVLRHTLFKSEMSGRMALPEYAVTCSLTGRRVLSDEVEKSDVTGKYVSSGALKISALSGKKAEPDFFAKCEFTFDEVLKTELRVSQISGKKYRMDEEVHSAVSGKSGHRQEFIFCSQTDKPLLSEESEKCEVTGKVVMPGILETCEVSEKKVLPSELERCVVTGKKALKKYFVSSSISDVRLLKEEATQSSAGKFCTPKESQQCIWSSQKSHPDDLKICSLTDNLFHSELIDKNNYFKVLSDLLNKTRNKDDQRDLWNTIATQVAKSAGGGRGKVESAELSPDKRHLAVCVEIKTWVGLKIRYAGLIYSPENHNIAGRLSLGKRNGNSWSREL